MYTIDWDPNDGSILRSTDQGATWSETVLPFKVGGNMPGRGVGEVFLTWTNFVLLGDLTMCSVLWSTPIRTAFCILAPEVATGCGRVQIMVSRGRKLRLSHGPVRSLFARRWIWLTISRDLCPGCEFGVYCGSGRHCLGYV